MAKLHKLGERQGTPDRLIDKDAHDICRLLVAVPTDNLTTTLTGLRDDPLAGATTEKALTYLQQLFATGPQATGSTMAGRTTTSPESATSTTTPARHIR